MIPQALKFIAISAGITALIPLGLILSQPVTPIEPAAPTLDFTSLLQDKPQAEEAPSIDPETIYMRDGYGLQVRSYSNGDGPLIVLVHGSGWNGLQFSHLAPQLAGTVLVPDLRGHGAQPGRRGDVNYIGQLEDDLADLITARVGLDQKVVLVGHSSGGGLVVRFAGGAQGDLLDGAVLLAPFLHHSAPTMRANSGGWAQPLLRRIIGLSMLNAVGIKAWNRLPVIQFNMPAEVLQGPLGHLATTSYSYRLNKSYAPRSDYLSDIRSLPEFLLLAGAQDEAFIAEAYRPLMEAETDKGAFQVLEDTGHLDLVDAPQTLAAIRGYLDAF
ncbi:alpha/beta fold hydrolase [Pseudophaeobacter sp.]|uniref:alpha/beta hydrolase n=2 Tax=Pseudophaeobacter sp. TaxID=1971739 RepID=UPI0025FB2312|nr:alpha/beta fold hydrolase [uncultured Pseudophaeobacter sp.]